MRVAPVREELELLGLAGGGVADVLAAVPGVHAEQRRQPVEVAPAVLVPDVAALAPDQDRHLVLLVVRAHAREVHPEVAAGQLLEPGARCALCVRLEGGLGGRGHGPPRRRPRWPLRTTVSPQRRTYKRSYGETMA